MPKRQRMKQPKKEASHSHGTSSNPYNYELLLVEDKWSEVIPPMMPLQHSFYRYLGFALVKTNRLNDKKYIRSGSRARLCLRILNESGTGFEAEISNHFKDGVFYFQDIYLQELGRVDFDVHVESEIFEKVKPFHASTIIYEHMTLDQCPMFCNGSYGPLRKIAEEYAKLGKTALLNEPEFIQEWSNKDKGHRLRKIDVIWFFRNFVQRLDIEREKRDELKKKCERKRQRKADHPVRSGTAKEHAGYFLKKPKSIKSRRDGKFRIFAMERLSANTTVTVYSNKEIYMQLANYVKIRK